MQNSEPSHPFHICVCTNNKCRLRFPALADDSRAQSCPLCGSPVTQVVQGGYGIESTLAGQPSRLSRLHLLLDNIRSAFNVGSIFRIADGAGVQHIYLCGITPTPDNRKVAKTALGAESSVGWSYHRNALDLTRKLTSSGKRLIALERNADSELLFDVAYSMLEDDIVLIAGNEVTGIDPGLLNVSDSIVHLPMAGVKGSLNVAVALGIAVYLLRD